MANQRRVLITGIEGFTGRHLASELDAHGWDVFGTGIRARGNRPNYRQADLTKYEEIQSIVGEIKPDAVVHLAAVAFVAHGDADAFYQVNVIGTRNLLRALADSQPKPQCVVIASSANIYGNAKEGRLSEATPANPANDYAVSKLAMEYMAKLWMDKLPIVISRPFNYTGRGQNEKFLLPKIVAHFKAKAEVIELGNVDVSRDFSDVRAVVEAYRRLLDACPAGEVLNVCSGRTYSLREIISIAERITSHQISITVNPKYMRANEVKTLSGDPSKLRQSIGEYCVPKMEDTLRWMLESD